jgi:hypothetical protein
MRRSIAILAAAGATALAASAPPASAATTTGTTADAAHCIQLWTGVPGCIGLDTPCRVRDELAEHSAIVRDNVHLYCLA